MFFAQALHNGSPDFMLAVLALFAALVMSQTVTGSGIGQHPYVRPGHGGELASDLPPESIGRPEIEPLLLRHPRNRTRPARRRWGSGRTARSGPRGVR
jgi:hypothetical protein